MDKKKNNKSEIATQEKLFQTNNKKNGKITFITESRNNSESEETQPKSWFRWWFLLILALIAIVISITGAIWWYINTFERASGQEASTLINHIKSGWDRDPFGADNAITVLLLGLDEIRNQREGSKLTDTIMLIQANRNGEITLLSLPRDLWIDSLKTKINAVYYYGEESDQTSGVELVETVIDEISGLTVDESLVVSMEDVRSVIDALGGIEVVVERSFVDNKFPRDDVDVATVSDPDLLYETVSFDKGVQHFDGATALKFIRSRNSEDAEEGTDLARSKRQQQVILAIVDKLQSISVIFDPSVIGGLYSVWQEIDTSLTETTLVGIGRQINLENQPELVRLSIPIQDDDTSGIIYNPPITQYEQWVYAPVDETWTEFQLWIDQNFR